MKPTIFSLAALQEALSQAADTRYRDFQASLIPTVDKERILGIRVPKLRRLSGCLDPDTAEAFLHALPHKSYDEDNLHAFLIERIGDFEATLAALDVFLPYVNNWATCDMMRPKCLSEKPEALQKKIEVWLASSHTYTVRYGIGMLMTHFFGKSYTPAVLEQVASIHTKDYYIQMMCAWFFATALTLHPEDTLPYLTEARLDPTLHRMTLRKVLDSHRIPSDLKACLKGSASASPSVKTRGKP